jgi:virginiamycin B lyase
MNSIRWLIPLALVALSFLVPEGNAIAAEIKIESFRVVGAGIHDVAPAPNGDVWYTVQRGGALGVFDPKTGESVTVALGPSSAPHGFITGPDGNAWITDGGQNAIVRVDARTREVKVYRLPQSAPHANLNTVAFDARGRIWFTGQSGYHGVLDPATGAMEVWPSPRGRGPYGITATPAGDIYFASLADSYLGKVDLDTGAVTVLDPPTRNAGVRRVWSDSKCDIWISEWNAGQVGRYSPATNTWKEWQLPGARPMAYAVYVDEKDIVWLTDFGGNAVVRFDPVTEQFQAFQSPRAGASVRQLLGRVGEVWAPESGTGNLVVFRTAANSP